MVYRPTEKTEAKKAEIRLKILSAAKSLVLAGGFRELAMSAVANKAEVATGSLYRHFANKTDLCTELFCIASGEEVAHMRSVAESNASAEEKLGLAIETFLIRAFKGANLAWALIAEPLDPALEQQRIIYRRNYVDVFVAVINQGIQENTFAAQNPRIVATAIVGALAESLVEPLSPETHSQEPYSLEMQQTLIQQMQSFCLSAISTK